MEAGSGIEVLEEERRTRIFLPESAPGRGSVDVWRAALMGILFGMVVFGGLVVPEMSEPIICLCGLGWLWIVKLALGQGMLGRMVFKGRVELVVDRGGVRQRAWGAFYWWRVKLKEANGVVVCPPMPAWADQGDVNRLATVRVAGKSILWGAVWGAYEPKVAVEAALILQEQIERRRELVGVVGPVVMMWDEMGIARVETRAEEILESSNVATGSGENGVRVELAVWKEKRLPREDEPFLALTNGFIFLVIGLAVLLVGALGGALIAEGLGKGQGVLNVVGLVVSFASILCGFVWMFGVMYVRVTYEIGRGGVERITRLYGVKWKRRWNRDEIDGVYLRQAQVGVANVWMVGIQKRDGKKVKFAAGWQRDARALAEVIERALGFNDKRSGSV